MIPNNDLAHAIDDLGEAVEGLSKQLEKLERVVFLVIGGGIGFVVGLALALSTQDFILVATSSIFFCVVGYIGLEIWRGQGQK